MSDTSQGQGWWLASDGRWYPPEAWTGPPSQAPQGPQTPQGPQSSQGADVPPTPQATATSEAPSYPNYPSNPTSPGYPTYGIPSYGNPSYGATPNWQQAVPPPSTNGFAIASLVCSCAGPFFLGIGCILGIVFGFVARSQIRQSNGTQNGGGLALAGIIVGFVIIALFVLVVVLIAVFATNVTHCNGSFNSCSVN